jgi:hypothetical protein
MKSLFITAAVLCTLGTSAFASSTNFGSEIALCQEASSHKYSLQVLKSHEQYFISIKNPNSKDDVIGPADQVIMENQGNRLTLIFNQRKLWLIVNQGQNTQGSAGGEIGGDNLTCNAKW